MYNKIEEIKTNENWFRVELPQDYIDYILDDSKLIFEKKCIKYGTDKYEASIQSFLFHSDDYEEYEHLEDYDIGVVISQIDSRICEGNNSVGFKIIPFLALDGGDFICFDFREDENNPIIVRWDHEISEEFSPYVLHVANSFTEFVGMIKNC